MGRYGAYPMEWAGFVPVDELALPGSHLNLENKYSYNNHHLVFPMRKMARLLITQTFRDLERNQVIMPKDQHQTLHDLYGPPELPGILALMDVIGEAWQKGEQLRYGSAWNPTFEPLSDERWRACARELERVA